MVTVMTVQGWVKQGNFYRRSKSLTRHPEPYLFLDWLFNLKLLDAHWSSISDVRKRLMHPLRIAVAVRCNFVGYIANTKLRSYDLLLFSLLSTY